MKLLDFFEMYDCEYDLSIKKLILRFANKRSLNQIKNNYDLDFEEFLFSRFNKVPTEIFYIEIYEENITFLIIKKSEKNIINNIRREFLNTEIHDQLKKLIQKEISKLNKNENFKIDFLKNILLNENEELKLETRRAFIENNELKLNLKNLRLREMFKIEDENIELIKIIVNDVNMFFSYLDSNEVKILTFLSN